jgi:hypothetical protein
MNWPVARQIRASVFSPATVARPLQGTRTVAGAFLSGDLDGTRPVAETTTPVPPTTTVVANTTSPVPGTTDVATP